MEKIMKCVESFALMMSLLIFSNSAFSCSTASYEDNRGNPWVIKSFDYDSGDGHLFINKKNVMKKGFVVGAGEGESWISKYGSVTFNQISIDFPYGGLNEAGLNMEIMWLSESKYPQMTKKTNLINESQIIQYVLDTSATLDEAIEQIKKIQLAPIMATVHYMICDVENKCAAIEFLNGELVVSEMDANGPKILQNSTYAEDLNAIKNNGSTSRNQSEEINFIFNNATADSEEKIVNKSFQNLEKLKQGNFSKWQIAYNLRDKKIWFQSVQSPYLKQVDLSDYEFDCKLDRSERMISINSPLTGDIQLELQNYTIQANITMLNGLENVPDPLKIVANEFVNANRNCVK